MEALWLGYKDERTNDKGEVGEGIKKIKAYDDALVGVWKEIV